ncbi:hypothetical protein PpBr36_05336, partial [Pyricularia pennisetigena]|uniref:hypothetical protein n=1 Tax=Pyricularia pennisetigena TaxID=1578925 RepID=UPI0011539ECF
SSAKSDQMCGRYALALRPDQIRQRLRANNMPVWEDPEDHIYEIGDGAGGENDNNSAPASAPTPAPTSAPSQGQPRQSYNFAPGYYGVVYRADAPDWGAGPRKGDGDDKQGSEDERHEWTSEPHYKLQAMKWGLIPFWTKRNPDYSSMMKTINCRDDSLAVNGGMWNTMKARKRCIVIAEGFYEWLKVGPKERVPYYIKRKDGGLLLLAGLWDCVKYENDDRKHYTYTIITTDSNKALKFLHDRMPVILEPASDDLATWLDPKKHEWTEELQSILKPWDGELEIYAVSKDVNKVGNNSSSFIVPVASKENKNNIANFFANASGAKKDVTKGAADARIKDKAPQTKASELENEKDSSPKNAKTPVKRPADVGPLNPDEEPPPPKKQAKIQSSSPTKKSTAPTPRKTISATSNSGKRSPTKGKVDPAGTQKITKFFSK